MAIHAQKLGMPVTVCMPTTAPLPKVQNCLNYDANVVLKGQSIGDVS